MSTDAIIEERSIWQLAQAGYTVIIETDHHYIVLKDIGGVIATPASLDELRDLADQFYELVWLGYRKVTAA